MAGIEKERSIALERTMESGELFRRDSKDLHRNLREPVIEQAVHEFERARNALYTQENLL